jgi:hypothetical protein
MENNISTVADADPVAYMETWLPYVEGMSLGEISQLDKASLPLGRLVTRYATSTLAGSSGS